uniref:Uncharacterized protein n=1 Tax=Podoviridae sp. ctZkC8 TaxID=2825259 RepID=A0A8S5UBH8_9CAUD|nr:MAG TPA: hypothetical protein [Podoviridae sp. ctZkC8]
MDHLLIQASSSTNYHAYPFHLRLDIHSLDHTSYLSTLLPLLLEDEALYLQM